MSSVNWPDPLRKKINEWGLPSDVLASLLDTLDNRVRIIPKEPKPAASAHELSLSDSSGALHQFYVWLRVDWVGDSIVIIDAGIERLD